MVCPELQKTSTFGPSFCLLIDENKKKVLAQVEPHGAETDGWTLVNEEGGILVSKKELRDSSLIMSRAEGRIRASASQVLELLYSQKYDPLVISCKIIKVISSDVDIAHIQTRSPFPLLSNRDFVLLRSKHRSPETGKYLFAKSFHLNTSWALQACTSLVPHPSPSLYLHPRENLYEVKS